jgi:hypothetical protein
MSTILFGLVDREMQVIMSSWRILDPSSREGLIIFCAIAFVTVLALLWAVFLRKRWHRHHSHHHHTHGHSSALAETPAAPNDGVVPASPHKHRRWRRQRRPHHPRNPTLAETGGLPPIRSEDSSEPLP